MKYFSNCCTYTPFWPSEIPWWVDKCITEGWWWYSETVKSLYCAANKLRGTFDLCSPVKKTLYFVPVKCQCMLANCGANTHRLVWTAYVLRITVLTELWITYPEMLVIAHTRLHIVSGPLMPCWETICIDFLYNTHLHLTFSFDRFKCLMLFTNLNFPQIFNAPICWRPTVVFVGALFRCSSHQ